MRRTVRGYFDMGRRRFPELPAHLILTDRGTGTKYVVSYSTAVDTVDGYGHITINSTLPNCTRQECRIYEAYDEPYVGNPAVKLYIRDGHLGMDVEHVQGITDQDNAKLFARKALLRTPREIVVYTGTRYTLRPRLAWTPWSL